MLNTDEDKSQRFKRVAAARTERILDNIRLLGNCGNRNTYSYTDEEVAKIYSAIEQELKTSRARFKKTTKRSFSL
jgi:hypothetical protein